MRASAIGRDERLRRLRLSESHETRDGYLISFVIDSLKLIRSLVWTNLLYSIPQTTHVRLSTDLGASRLLEHQSPVLGVESLETC